MEETLFLKRESKLSKFKISDDIYYQEEKNFESEGEPIDTFNKNQGLIGVLTNLNYLS